MTLFLLSLREASLDSLRESKPSFLSRSLSSLPPQQFPQQSQDHTTKAVPALVRLCHHIKTTLRQLMKNIMTSLPLSMPSIATQQFIITVPRPQHSAAPALARPLCTTLPKTTRRNRSNYRQPIPTATGQHVISYITLPHNFHHHKLKTVHTQQPIPNPLLS